MTEAQDSIPKTPRTHHGPISTRAPCASSLITDFSFSHISFSDIGVTSPFTLDSAVAPAASTHRPRGQSAAARRLGSYLLTCTYTYLILTYRSLTPRPPHPPSHARAYLCIIFI